MILLNLQINLHRNNHSKLYKIHHECFNNHQVLSFTNNSNYNNNCNHLYKNNKLLLKIYKSVKNLYFQKLKILKNYKMQ